MPAHRRRARTSPPWLALALGLAVFARAAAAGGEPALADGVAAVVDDAPILVSEVRARAVPYLRVMEQEVKGKRPAERRAAERDLYRDLLARLVDERLVARAAAEAFVAVTAGEVDATMRRIAEHNAVSVAELVAKAAESGLSEAAYRDELQRQVLEGKMLHLRFRNRRIPLAPAAEGQAAQLDAERKAWLSELRQKAYVETRVRFE